MSMKRVIIYTTRGMQTNVADRVEALGGQVLYIGKYSGYVVALIPEDKLMTVRALSGVTRIVEDRPVGIAQVRDTFFRSESITIVPLYDAVKFIHADNVWDIGITGSGIKVAVIDTGVNKNHEMLKGKVVKEHQIAPGDINDGCGHGTWVASAICGRMIEHEGKLLSGVAPDSRIINIKCLDDAGVGMLSWVLEAMELAIDFNANIASMSLGGYFPDPKGPAFDIIAEGNKRGTFFVIAAGNDGPLTSTISYPATCPNAIAVGAVSVAVDPKKVAWFSSRGPVNGYIKPDVVAPGGYGDIKGEYQKIEKILGAWRDGYAAARGTSMATPLVSGSLALFLQVAGSVSFSDLINTLSVACEDLGVPKKDNDYGWGLIRADKLVRQIDVSREIRSNIPLIIALMSLATIGLSLIREV